MYLGCQWGRGCLRRYSAGWVAIWMALSHRAERFLTPSFLKPEGSHCPLHSGSFHLLQPACIAKRTSQSAIISKQRAVTLYCSRYPATAGDSLMGGGTRRCAASLLTGSPELQNTLLCTSPPCHVLEACRQLPLGSRGGDLDWRRLSGGGCGGAPKWRHSRDCLAASHSKRGYRLPATRAEARGISCICCP